MVVARKDVRAAMSDNVNQTAQSLIISEGRYEVVRTPLERGNADCPLVDRGVPKSSPPSAVHPDESVVEMQFKSHDPNIDMTDSNGQPALLSAAHGKRPLN